MRPHATPPPIVPRRTSALGQLPCPRRRSGRGVRPAAVECVQPQWSGLVSASGACQPNSKSETEFITWRYTRRHKQTLQQHNSCDVGASAATCAHNVPTDACARASRICAKQLLGPRQTSLYNRHIRKRHGAWRLPWPPTVAHHERCPQGDVRSQEPKPVAHRRPPPPAHVHTPHSGQCTYHDGCRRRLRSTAITRPSAPSVCTASAPHTAWIARALSSRYRQQYGPATNGTRPHSSARSRHAGSAPAPRPAPHPLAQQAFPPGSSTWRHDFPLAPLEQLRALRPQNVPRDSR